MDGKRAELPDGSADVFCRRHGFGKTVAADQGCAGFSLVELLIGLALTALLLQALYPVLSVSLLSWRTTAARTEVHQSARLALEAMTRDLRLASIVAWPPPGGSDSRVSIRTMDTNGKQVAIGFQQGLPDGGNSRTLYRTYAQGRPSPLTRDVVSTLRFEYSEPRLVKIALTLTDPQTGVQDSATTAVTCVNVAE